MYVMDESPAPPARLPVVVRLRQSSIAQIDKLAADRKQTRSEIMRVMLGYASVKMPPDYMKPKDPK